ncbi:MAG: hypothetical protein JNL41_03170 [Phenylobacterium sp.]|uniref:hypothetical protein n=1 Tax=Phenylobacterium sp. TaxID=1871053 RepID=UPI001A5CCFEF|nr:hypothetical protein [Phenylobacterium sp.]MBL8553254.1 hypothetical protein [Phenylobacterium sp.]
MLRTHLPGLVGLAALLSACTPTLGPPPPGGRPAPPPPPPPMSGSAQFNAGDFAWSQRPGGNIIAGRVAYAQGRTRYTCAGSSVVLTPETAWSARRMAALYGSAERAALPADEVRARTPAAPPGDAGPYVKRTTCDDADQFAFGGLADGAWYAITIVRPVGGPGGTMALMKRVVVRGGRTVPLAL